MNNNRSDNPAFREKVLALQEKYKNALPGKYDEICQSWQAYQQQPADAETYDTFYRVIHTFKGTSATFGFSELADICFEIQKVLMEIRDGREFDNTVVKTVDDHLANFKNKMQDAVITPLD